MPPLSLLLAAAALPAIILHPDGAMENSLHGTARWRDGRTQSATLWIGCRLPEKFSAEVDLADADAEPDAADFFPRDGARRDPAPAYLTWTTSRLSVSAMLPAQGYRPLGGKTLTLYIEAPRQPPSAFADLLRGIDDRGGTLIWQQSALGKEPRGLRAEFTLDATQSHNMKGLVDACLAPPPGG